MKKSKKKRKTMKLSELPVFPQAKDKLPAPAEYNGKRMRWVGFGWVDEGEATGTEPLLIVDDHPASTFRS